MQADQSNGGGGGRDRIYNTRPTVAYVLELIKLAIYSSLQNEKLFIYNILITNSVT